MNDELKAKLLEMLSEIHEAAKSGGNFVMDQAPDVARETILLGRIQATSLLVMGLLCIIAGTGMIMRFRRKFRESVDNRSKRDDAFGGALFFGVFPTVVGILISGANLRDCLMAWFTPRLYLIDYIRSLL